MAQTKIEIKKGMLLKEWKKGLLVATALLEDSRNLYISRTSGDQEWAYQAAEYISRTSGDQEWAYQAAEYISRTSGDQEWAYQAAE